jgi:aspartate/methionine/tyrosine aminotransferase
MSPAANSFVIDTATPPIPEARAWLERYDGRHGSILNLSQAAPGSAPPSDMLAALGRAAADPTTATYGPILGEMALREVYAAQTGAMYGARISIDEIAITTGCNQAFITALLAVAKAGDAVMLPEPWYFNHQMTLQMLGYRVVPLPCRSEAGFVPDLAEARALLAKTPCKVIVLVTPNNPTGAIYAPDVIRGFASLANEHGAWMILDETYRDFLDTAGAKPHDLFNAPELAAHVLQLYSFSKSYAMPGHRLGALRAPVGLMPEIAKVLDCLQICAPRVGQAALIWAIPSLASWREANRAEIVTRANAFTAEIVGEMGRSTGWAIHSIGAYFAYVAHPFGATPAQDIARRLAETVGILALPGTFFGGPDQSRYLRVAFANADSQALAGLARRLQALA